MAAVKDLTVRFELGKDVLNAYWGYLSHGGLVFDDRQALEIGASVALRIEIGSLGKNYALCGTMLRRQSDDGRAVIAFAPGEPHDVLLTDALAEAENVPARRSRRFDVQLSAEVTGEDDGDAAALVTNVSRDGCCLHLRDGDRRRFPVGTAVTVVADDLRHSGVVMWVSDRDRGVRFATEVPAAVLDDLVSARRERPRI